MDIAKMEDNLSGAHWESTDFIMEIGLQPDWHNEVNQAGVRHLFCWLPMDYFFFHFFLKSVTLASFEVILIAGPDRIT